MAVQPPVLELRGCAQGLGHLGARAGWVGDLGGECAGSRSARHPAAALARLRVPAASGLAAWQVVEAVAGESPADATVAVDAGAHMFAAANFWRASEPLHFLISNGLASMGSRCRRRSPPR